MGVVKSFPPTAAVAVKASRHQALHLFPNNTVMRSGLAEHLQEQDLRAEERKRVKKQLSCSACPPNRGENAKRRPKHGVTKPRHKDHGRNTLQALTDREREWEKIEKDILDMEIREGERRENAAPCCGMHRDDCGCDYTPTTRNEG